MGGKPNGWVMFGAVALAAGLAIYLWVINLAILRDADRARIDELQMELMATRDALRQSGGDAGFLAGASISPLKANDRVAKKAGGAVLHRGSSLFIAARHLPPAPKGKAYALWAYVDGKPVSAGEFQVGQDGVLRGRHSFGRDLSAVEGFALTLENAGGVDSPAGPVFLMRP